MNCDQAHELYSDYITGDLDPALRVKVENHLEESASCRDALEEMRRIWAELDHFPVAEPPASFHSELMARLSAELDAPPIQEKRWPVLDLRALFQPRALALAATLLICSLACIEVVQTQRAALGPLGELGRLLHPSALPHPGGVNAETVPAPTAALAIDKGTLHLRDAYAEWIPQSGTLVVHLQAAPVTDSSGGALTFTVTLKRKLPDLPAAQQPIVATAKVSLNADEKSDVTLTSSEAPTPAANTLEVTATSVDGQESQSLPIPLPTN